MLTRACSIASRTAGFSSSPRCVAKPSAAPRRFTKAYCAPAPEQTLAEAVAKDGILKSFPAGTPTADEPSERVLKLADMIMNSSFIEVAQLTRVMQKRLGTSGVMASPMMMAPAAGAAAAAPAAAAPAAEAAKPAEPTKPTRADVKLVSFPDANKFKVLKEIRNLKPGMNLMESKSLIEGLPKVVQEGLLYKEAEDWKKALTEAGAEVELV